MRGQSRRRPPRQKRYKKALAMALASVLASNGAGVGMLVSFAEETGVESSYDMEDETGGLEETGDGENEGTGGLEETGDGENEGTGGLEGTGDGENEGTGDGENEGTGDGENEGTGDGENEGTGDGENEETGDGEDEGTGDGENEGTGDGENEGTGDGEDEGTGDGENEETGDGEDEGTGDGENEGTEGGENEGTGDGENEGTEGGENGGLTNSMPQDGAPQSGPTDGQDSAEDKVGIEYVVTPEDGAVVNGPDQVKVGEDLAFQVELEEGYAVAFVYANEEELQADHTATGSELENSVAYYYLEDVTEDTVIEVQLDGAMALDLVEYDIKPGMEQSEINEVLKSTDKEEVIVQAGDYSDKTFSVADKTLTVDGTVTVKGLSLNNATVQGLHEFIFPEDATLEMEEDEIFEGADKLIVKQDKGVVRINGDVEITEIDLQIRGDGAPYSVLWSSGTITTNHAGFSVEGSNVSSGYGVYVQNAVKGFTGNNSYVSFSNHKGKNESGLVVNDEASINFTFELTNGIFKANNNGLNGIQSSNAKTGQTFIFIYSDVETSGNGTNKGFTSSGDGFSYGHYKFVSDGSNRLVMNNNKGKGLGGGSSAAAGLYMEGYTVEANGNNSIGINASKPMIGYDEIVIKDCEIHANDNSTGIELSGTANISDSTKITAAENSTGISFKAPATVTNSTLNVNGNRTTGIKNVSELRLEDSIVLDDGATTAYTGYAGSADGTAVMILSSEETVVTLNGSSDEDGDGKLYYKSFLGEYKGDIQVQNGSLQASSPITYPAYAQVLAGGAYSPKMTKNPINTNGTPVYRFDLHEGYDHGTLLKNAGDGIWSFTYLDGETPVSYGFRYNESGEDLDSGAGNAYVWTTVGTVSYDATEGAIASANTATVRENARFADDVVINGGGLNLSERTKPEAKKDGLNFGGWFIPADGQKAAEYAAAGNWAALYEQLDVRNGAVLFDGDVPVDGSVTVYAKWLPINKYTITVNYLQWSEDGNHQQISDSVLLKNADGTTEWTEGDSYDVSGDEALKKEISGYTFRNMEGAVSGTNMTGNVVINVFYDRTPSTPSGGGNGGGGNSSGGGSVVTPGDRNPGPGVMIDDGQVPLADIPEAEVPMSDSPVLIAEEETPLAALPKTGQNQTKRGLALFGLLSGISLLVFGSRTERKKRLF